MAKKKKKKIPASSSSFKQNSWEYTEPKYDKRSAVEKKEIVQSFHVEKRIHVDNLH